MSDNEATKVNDSIKQGLTRLSDAQSATAAAEQAAGNVQANVARLGFQGIATRLTAVRQQLTHLLGQQTSTAGDVEGCKAHAEKVTDESTPAQVINNLAPVVQKTGAALPALAHVMQELNKLKQQVGAILDGGEPGPLQAAIDRPIKVCAASRMELNGAHDAAEALVAKARQAGAQAGK